MGTDVTAITCHHRLNLKEPLDFFRQISDIYRADIEVSYYSYKLGKGPFVLFQDTYEQGEPEERLEILLQDLPYLNRCIKKGVMNIDWNVPQLIKDFAEDMQNGGCIDIQGFKDWDDETPICIRQEQIEFYIGDRWSFFTNYFTQPLTVQKLSYLNDFRKTIAHHSRLLGCQCAIYFPDQGYGDAIRDEALGTTEKLMDYIKTEMSKPDCLCLNLPDFISHNHPPLTDIPDIFVVMDDFSDFGTA